MFYRKIIIHIESLIHGKKKLFFLIKQLFILILSEIILFSFSPFLKKIFSLSSFSIISKTLDGIFLLRIIRKPMTMIGLDTSLDRSLITKMPRYNEKLRYQLLGQMDTRIWKVFTNNFHNLFAVERLSASFLLRSRRSGAERD